MCLVSSSSQRSVFHSKECRLRIQDEPETHIDSPKLRILDEHEVLCSSIGKVHLTGILKGDSGFEVGRMSNCIIQLLTKSYCHQSHVNSGAVCRIREVTVLSGSTWFRQLCNSCLSFLPVFSVFYFEKHFKPTEELETLYNECLYTLHLGASIVNILLHFLSLLSSLIVISTILLLL